MLGDIRSCLLDIVQDVRKPWTDLLAHRQQAILDRIERTARHVISETTFALAGNDFPYIEVKVAQLAAKGEEAKAVIACANDEDNLIALHRAGACILVLAHPSKFHGERRAEKAQPDQAEIPLEKALFPDGAVKAGAPGAPLALPAPAEGELPLDEAQARFEAAKAKALARQAKREAGEWRYDWDAGTRTSESTGEIQPIDEEALPPALLAQCQAARATREERAAEGAAAPERKRRGKGRLTIEVPGELADA